MANEKAEPGVVRQTAEAVISPIAAILSPVISLATFLSEDKAFSAFFRQGVNELANAFGEMFPQGVTTTEPGSMFHPLHSDLAVDREQPANKPGLPSPSQIAQGSNAVGPVQNELQLDRQPLPSPSEIGREPPPHSPEQGHSHDNGNGR